MKKDILLVIAGTGLFISSCENISENRANNTSDSQQEVSINADTTEMFDELIYGAWVQPNPINEKEVQGFKLNKDSSAQSINMATLIYKYWWLRDHNLFLVSESKGNKQSSTDTIVYQVIQLTNQQLILKDRHRIVNYRKL